jgi:hypothetical protein
MVNENQEYQIALLASFNMPLIHHCGIDHLLSSPSIPLMAYV